MVGFEDWSTKAAILDALWDKPKILIEGQLTLKRRRELKFLTVRLSKLGIPYRWGSLLNYWLIIRENGNFE